MPWGLLVVLAVYAACVVGYVWKTYWESPDYLAAEHATKALTLLGVDDGRKTPEAELEEAFNHLLEAARLIPENKELAVHVERLRWRFEERGFKLKPDLVRKAELVSGAARQVEEERSPWLAVGSRDRGWAPDQLLAGPERVAWWSSPGFVLIIAVWGYGQFGARRVRRREHEAALVEQEQQLKELGRFREGLGAAPTSLGTTAEAETTDATVAQPAPRPRRTSTSGGRSAATRSTQRREGQPRAAEQTAGSRPAVARRPKDGGA